MILSQKSSKYIGVVACRNGYSTTLYMNNNRVYLGISEDEATAAIKYDEYIRHHNIGRRLNFPEPEPKNLIPNTRLI